MRPMLSAAASSSVRVSRATRLAMVAVLALGATGLVTTATAATATAATATAATATAATATATAAAQGASCPSSDGVAVPEAKASGDVVFRGGGWGHGLGMSQYGAQGAARLGCDATQILTRYYAGTKVSAAAMPTPISLRLLEKGYRVDATAVTGDVTWELGGCTPAAPAPGGCAPVQPKGATWQLRLDETGAQYVLWDLAVRPWALVWQGGGPGQPLRLRHSGTVVRLTTWRSSSIYLDRQLRWGHTRFGIVTPGAATGRLDGVQVIEGDATGSGMDKYLWGIAEVPASFPAEALKAQAIAARTYAAKRAGRVLSATPADQNYTGYAKESEGADAIWGTKWRAAVDATSGKVLVSTSTGALVDTFYCSSMGGHTEDERYVWGLEAPFLRAVDDSRWDLASSNPAGRRSWARGVSWATLASRLGFQRVTDVSVPKRGATTRVAGVRVTGFRSTGPRSTSLVTTYVEGWDVRQALGLLSPGFEISMRRIGGTAATPIVGDWDGDGREEPGWFLGGDIALRMSDRNGTWVKRYRYGKAGDVPVVGDWDANGSDSVGVFRAGDWLLRNAQSAGAPSLSFAFGAAGDRPVVGTWRKATTPSGHAAPGIGVVRAGVWKLRTTATAGATQLSFRFGRVKGDVPVVGDWDGDGTTTVGARRSNHWLLRDSVSGGPATRTFRYGSVTHRAVPGDWDGDGTTTAGVVGHRTFHLRNLAGGGKATAVVRLTG